MVTSTKRRRKNRYAAAAVRTRTMPKRMTRSVAGMPDAPYGHVTRRSAPEETGQGPHHVGRDRSSSLDRPSPGPDASLPVDGSDVRADSTSHHARSYL